MQATFYTFSKRENSTAQPTGGGASYPIKLKDACSTISPAIILLWPGSGSPAAYNYMYIPDFGRYYFIDSWTYTDRQWIASGRVDVLASWRNQIGAAEKYILRSASDADLRVIDRLYPSKMPARSFSTALAGLTWSTNLNEGRFIVSVVGQGNGYSAAGAGFYVLTWGEIQQLIDDCFTETADQWDNITSLGSSVGEVFAAYGDKITKSIQNPIQFISSVLWVPFVPQSGIGPYPAIKLGRTTASISGTPLGSPIHVQTFTAATVPPAGAADWEYMAPYAEYTLFIPPFGVFDIDSGRLVSDPNNLINGRIVTDCLTGQAVLEVQDGSGELILTATAMLAIPIELSGSSVNYAGMIQQTAQAAGGLVGSLLRGDVTGAVSGGVSGAVSIAQAAAPHSVNGGVGGGLAAFNSTRALVTNIYPHVDQDIPDKGRPLMALRQISTLSGYMICNDGEISAPASKPELQEIAGYLTGGFYYE